MNLNLLKTIGETLLRHWGKVLIVFALGGTWAVVESVPGAADTTAGKVTHERLQSAQTDLRALLTSETAVPDAQ